MVTEPQQQQVTGSPVGNASPVDTTSADAFPASDTEAALTSFARFQRRFVLSLSLALSLFLLVRYYSEYGGGGLGMLPFAREVPPNGNAAGAGGAAALTPVQALLPPIQPDTIGALMVAFENPRAVLEVLREYRAAYPEGDFILLCDNGCYNYSHACQHFKCEWEGRARKLTTKTNPGWFLTLPNSYAYLNALRDNLAKIRSKHYFYLETDVSIKGRVPLSSLRHTLNGIVDPNHGWMVGAEPFYGASLNPQTFDLSKFPDSPRKDMIPGKWLPYGGQGGTILNTQLMRAVATQPQEHRVAEMRTLGGCSTTTGVDYWHTAVVYRFNGTVGPYEGYSAGTQPGEELAAAQANPSVIVIHPDKSHYGADLSQEDLGILGPNWGDRLTASPEEGSDTPAPWDCCCPVKDFEFRLGATGLAEDEQARGGKWDMEDIRGDGYFKVP